MPRKSKAIALALTAIVASISTILILRSDATVMNNNNASYEVSATFNQPAPTVWDALTKKNLVDQYYLAPLMSDATRVGDEMAYGPPGQAMIVGQVVEFDAPTKLVHTFRFAGMPKTEETTVTYTLKSDPNATELRVEHTGFAKDSQFEADISGGWPIILEGLKALLEKRTTHKVGRI